MQCPGQDSRYWSGEDVFETKCPNCGHLIEFFKDDSQRTCRSCGRKLLNPRIDFGCAAYCPHAEQCLGSLPPQLAVAQGELFRDRLAAAVEQHFAQDSRSSSHAQAVAEQAELLARQEAGADMMTVVAAAYLQGLGRQEAEPGTDASGIAAAKAILTRLKVKEDLTEQVCALIRQEHSPGPEGTANAKVLHDAALIVNTAEQQPEQSLTQEQLDRLTAGMLTASGQAQARAVLERFVRT